MKTPPFLLGAALLFWGWQTGLLWVGAAAGAALEASHLLRTRWEFSQSDLDRLWNLCVALFLGATIYAFFSGESLHAFGDLLKDNSSSSRLATLNQSKRSLFQLLQWFAAMFFSMVLAQAYTQQDRFDLSTFSWWLRRQRSRPDFATRYAFTLNVTYPYLTCTLFAASASNQRDLWFSAGLVALVSWALWCNRSRTFTWVSWVSSWCLALALAFGVYLGMLEAQKLVQRLDELLLARWSSGRHFDAKENQTHLGAVGRMKLSGRIVLRVDANGQNPPELLREASYDLFRSPYWSSSKRNFERITPEVNQSTWLLHPAAKPTRRATISCALPGGSGLLALPPAVARLEQLPALGVSSNLFGSVRVEDGPGFVQVDTAYGDGAWIEAAPGAEDSDVPTAERPAVSQIAASLHLQQLPPAERVRVLERFFAENFTYSLWQDWKSRSVTNQTALSRFLLEHRSGHCEYFATATTLLLREAHIPARYTVGFAVQEKKGRYYVVRERHAHAWCLAWLNGHWQTVDTTPPSWAGLEASLASRFEPIRDFFSRAWFEFSRWRWGHTEWKRYLLWLIVPLLTLTLGKVLIQRQWNRSRQPGSRGRPNSLWPGLDSEFYLIEKRLTAGGTLRQPGETGSAWLQRVGQSGDLPVEGLDALLASHYRLRFHPQGLSPAERLHLRQQTEAWLKRAALLGHSP